jgi:hypothetical protein
MTCVSGIGILPPYSRDLSPFVSCAVLTHDGISACTLGAAIICVDIIVQQFPGKRDFKIQESSVFLSASLSLSSGVMVCSSGLP